MIPLILHTCKNFNLVMYVGHFGQGYQQQVFLKDNVRYPVVNDRGTKFSRGRGLNFAPAGGRGSQTYFLV